MSSAKPLPHHATPAQLLERLTELEIAFEKHDHPAVFTVEQARAHCADIPGGHCKNLFLRSKKKTNWLLVLPADAWVDLRAFAKQLGSGPLSFASPDRLFEFLGVTPGSVTPLSLINDPDGHVNVVFEQRLLEFTHLNFHPLINTSTLTLASQDVLAFVEHCGHTPIVKALPKPGQ